MRIHTITQIEFDDGSMSRPFTDVRVFDKPPIIESYVRTGLGIMYKPGQPVLVQTDSSMTVYSKVMGAEGFPVDEAGMSLAYELFPPTNPDCNLTLVQINQERDYLLFKTPSVSGIIGLEVMLIDPQGAQSNKIKYSVQVVGRDQLAD